MHHASFRNNQLGFKQIWMGANNGKALRCYKRRGISISETEREAMTTTTYLVTGANRGIGFALAKKISEDKNNLVYATARDLSKTDDLKALARDNVKVFQLDIEDSLEDITKLLSFIGDGAVDVVIQSAGIFTYGAENSVSTSIDHYQRHFDVNTLGPIKLYQAIFPIWSRDTNSAKKFVFISSAAASSGDPIPVSMYGYSLAKAALNRFVKEISSEHTSLYGSNEAVANSVTIAIHPGTVATDMGAPVIEKFQVPFITPDECGASIMELVQSLKPEDNGTFKDYNGTEHAW